MSVASHDNRSLPAAESVVCPKPDDSAERLPSHWTTPLKSIGYWAAWVAFSAWAFRRDLYYLMNGWWMVLVAFWLTANEISAAHSTSGRVRLLAIGSASVASAFLIFGTSEWLTEIAEGWNWGPPGQWLQLVALPIRAIVVSAVTAVFLVPQFRRHFGPYSGPLLVVAAMLVGIADFGAGLISVAHWREHWKASSIELFIVIILPMIIAATNERLSSLRWPPAGRFAAGLFRVWHGEMPTSAALLAVYPMTIAGVIWLISGLRDLSNHGYSDWEFATRKATVQLLLVLVLLVGSRVTWLSLNRSAVKGPQTARWLQGIVVLLAAPILPVFMFGVGFTVGNVITRSAKAALGSAYYLGVPERGVELQLSGEVTYGLADRLAIELVAHPSVRRVRLESAGGDISEAMRAARIIADHQLDTAVSGNCASACTVMFMAGKHRSMGKDARLGFHAAKSEDPTERVTGSFRGAFSPFGVDKRFVDRVEATKPPAIWYPTREELVDAGVLTTAN